MAEKTQNQVVTAAAFQDQLSQHREKLGWLEQTYLMGDAVHFNYDLLGLYRKQVADVIEAQTTDGLVPLFAASEIFFTNTTSEVMPVSQLEDVTYPVGEVTKRLHALYREAVAHAIRIDEQR